MKIKFLITVVLLFFMTIISTAEDVMPGMQRLDSPLLHRYCGFCGEDLTYDVGNGNVRPRRIFVFFCKTCHAYQCEKCIRRAKKCVQCGETYNGIREYGKNRVEFGRAGNIDMIGQYYDFRYVECIHEMKENPHLNSLLVKH